MQERDAQSASGKHWIFFGDQHFTTDFLYQLEWQQYLKSGLLTRMDVAFSRDQAEKIYVQHRMLEQQKDVYAWLEEGAYLYVCGDAGKMAKDVEHALLQIVQHGSGKDEEFAREYMANLRAEKRYQRDVY
jgi:sulfite reductase (NADPH) flavoprotein alpha-component